MFVLGMVVAVSAAVVTTVAIRATQRAVFGDPPRTPMPGVAPGDVAELSTAMARTAHLYRGFGHDRAGHRAVRTLDRSGRHRPRVWSIATLECETLGRSCWFRLDNGTAVRVDRPIATVAGDPDSATATPEALLDSAELVSARRLSHEVVIQFRHSGTPIELRGSGAAIL